MNSSKSIPKEIAKYVQSGKVMVFSLSYCPFCIMAKSTLKQNGVNYDVIELDEINNGTELQESTNNFTNHRTYPKTWVGTTFVGGNDDLEASIKNGNFQKLLIAENLA